MLEELKRRNICLSEEEKFVQNLQTKFKVLGSKRGLMGKQHDNFVSAALKLKLRDNNLHGVRIRRRRNYLRGVLEDSLGSRSPAFRKLIVEVKNNNLRLRKFLKEKYKKKVMHLTKKFGNQKTYDMTRRR